MNNINSGVSWSDIHNSRGRRGSISIKCTYCNEYYKADPIDSIIPFRSCPMCNTLHTISRRVSRGELLWDIICDVESDIDKMGIIYTRYNNMFNSNNISSNE